MAAIKKVFICTLWLFCLTTVYFGYTKAEAGFLSGSQHKVNSSKFFKLNVQNGEKLGNIFSRTIAYSGDGFTEVAYRAGGTGIYTVMNNNTAKPVFDGLFHYDGRPVSHYRIEISDSGKTVNYDGKPSTNTDGSGLLFNALIWGNPPASIKTGDTWAVNIGQAWELGGHGMQKVTVLDIDENNHSVRLMREGTADGFYDNDAKQLSISKDGKTVKVTVEPGVSHWIGYTTFKDGLVLSDELMVTRPVTLTNDSLKLEASEREYILLNAMPVS